MTCNVATDKLAMLAVPSEFRQLVLVTFDGWTSTNGTLETFERSEGRWCEVDSAIRVVLGKSGAGWGLGLHRPIAGEPQKFEGDHRAPAGIFRIGPAFGYAPSLDPRPKIAYRELTPRDYYVDDPASADYNRMVRLPAEANDPKARWRSFEVMRRPDGLYALGLVIQHNAEPTVAGRGSAIFFHIWRSPMTPTVGCTAMPADDVRRLIGWLDPALNPVLVQAPRSELGRLQFARSP